MHHIHGFILTPSNFKENSDCWSVLSILPRWTSVDKYNQAPAGERKGHLVGQLHHYIGLLFRTFFCSSLAALQNKPQKKTKPKKIKTYTNKLTHYWPLISLVTQTSCMYVSYRYVSTYVCVIMALATILMNTFWNKMFDPWPLWLFRSWAESEQQFYTDAEEMATRHRNPKGTSSLQIAVAEQDGE